MTDRAIGWIRQQKALMGDKPFFVYFAPGATHAPHHVPAEWSAKYKGKFDQGWDALREETLRAPEGARRRPARRGADGPPEEIPAWDEIPDDLKPVLARQMEVYAGFLEHTDHHVGRLVDALEDLGILEDTLVYYIIGDNGASAEGDVHGSFNELINLNGAAALQTTEFMAVAHRRVRHARGLQPLRGRLGARDGHAVPVDEAGRVALGRHAQRHDRALAEGHRGEGRGPQPVPPRDRRRSDGARGGRPPRADDGSRRRAEADRGREHALRVRRRRRRGAARDAVLRDVLQPRHLRQGLDRGHAPLDPRGSSSRLPPFADDTWELYDTNTDWSQAHDLAAEMPEKLEELKALFMEEARKYNVLPLDDRRVERFNSDLAGRPVLISGNSQLLFGGMGRLTENAVINVKNKSHSVTAELTGSGRRGRGRDHRPGRRLRRLEPVRQGRQAEVLLQPLRRSSASTSRATPIPPGTHQVRMEFAYDGGGLGKGGTVSLYVDGAKTGEGRVEGNRADALLGRRDLRRRLRHRLAGQRRLHLGGQPLHRHRSSGCRSTSPRPPRTSTT